MKDKKEMIMMVLSKRSRLNCASLFWIEFYKHMRTKTKLVCSYK